MRCLNIILIIYLIHDILLDYSFFLKYLGKFSPSFLNMDTNGIYSFVHQLYCVFIGDYMLGLMCGLISDHMIASIVRIRFIIIAYVICFRNLDIVFNHVIIKIVFKRR